MSVDLFGCVAFGVSTVARYVLTSTKADLDLAVTHVATSVGATAYLVGAVLLLREGGKSTD